MDLFDTFTLDAVKRTGDGYLTAFARVARTGVQVYKGSELGRPDLETVRLYRPPEEVFSADSMRSFAHRPVTLRHPSKPVTAKNWKQYAGGQTGEDVVRDGEFVRVPMVMMDARLIDAYEKEGIKELSMGYSTDIKWTPGIIKDSGEQYDAIQTSIRGNHLAVVPVARGGDQLRIGDAATKTCPECGAEVDASETECPECGYNFETDTNDGEPAMKTIVIDGLNVNVADDQSGTIIQKHIDVLTKRLADADTEAEAKKKKDAELDKELGDAKTTISAKDGEIAVLKKQVTDAAVTPAKLDELVKDRLTVIDAATKLLPKEFVFDGKTIVDIKRSAVIAKLGDATAKNLDDAAIGGAFAALSVDSVDKSGTQPIRDALAGRRPGGANLTAVADAAYEADAKARSEAWRNPGVVATQ